MRAEASLPGRRPLRASDSVWQVAFLGNFQRRAPSPVLSPEILTGDGREDEAQNVLMPCPGRLVQRLRAIRVDVAQVGVGCEQQLHQHQAAPLCGDKERPLDAVRRRVNRRPGAARLQQRLCDLRLVKDGSQDGRHSPSLKARCRGRARRQ